MIETPHTDPVLRLACYASYSEGIRNESRLLGVCILLYI